MINLLKMKTDMEHTQALDFIYAEVMSGSMLRENILGLIHVLLEIKKKALSLKTIP